VFKRSKDRTLRESAGYTAHHIIALAFMIIATVVGSAGLLVPGAIGTTAASRLLVNNGTVRWLAAVLLGELLIWDFPCALFIKQLRGAVIMAHHVGMVFVCALATLVPQAYGLFYLGACELSNIPLQVWEGFEYAKTQAEATGEEPRKVARLSKISEASYAIFSPLFVFVRIFAFTGITSSRAPGLPRTLSAAARRARPKPTDMLRYYSSTHGASQPPTRSLGSGHA
jgi:hypothetical protein